MAILDVFKKKRGVKKEKERKEVVKEMKKEKVMEERRETKVSPGKKERKFGEVYRILKIPHITEKATALAGKNQYVFKIWPKANKVEVKKAIEDLFGVDVIGVRIINIPRKKRRLGRIEGFRRGYKKAIVRIKEGQKIEVLPR